MGSPHLHLHHRRDLPVGRHFRHVCRRSSPVGKEEEVPPLHIATLDLATCTPCRTYAVPRPATKTILNGSGAQRLRKERCPRG